MAWLSNLRVGTKLTVSFMFVALTAAAMGFVGVKNAHRMAAADADLYDHMTAPMADLTTIAA